MSIWNYSKTVFTFINYFLIIRCALSKGWDIDIWSNKVLADSLNNCNDQNDPNVNMLLRSLATQAMEQAVYFSTGEKTASEWEHYGLALKHYTHFTLYIHFYLKATVLHCYVKLEKILLLEVRCFLFSFLR